MPTYAAVSSVDDNREDAASTRDESALSTAVDEVDSLVVDAEGQAAGPDGLLTLIGDEHAEVDTAGTAADETLALMQEAASEARSHQAARDAAVSDPGAEAAETVAEATPEEVVAASPAPDDLEVPVEPEVAGAAESIAADSEVADEPSPEPAAAEPVTPEEQSTAAPSAEPVTEDAAAEAPEPEAVESVADAASATADEGTAEPAAEPAADDVVAEQLEAEPVAEDAVEESPAPEPDEPPTDEPVADESVAAEDEAAAGVEAEAAAEEVVAESPEAEPADEPAEAPVEPAAEASAAEAEDTAPAPPPSKGVTVRMDIPAPGTRRVAPLTADELDQLMQSEETLSEVIHMIRISEEISSLGKSMDAMRDAAIQEIHRNAEGSRTEMSIVAAAVDRMNAELRGMRQQVAVLGRANLRSAREAETSRNRILLAQSRLAAARGGLSRASRTGIAGLADRPAVFATLAVLLFCWSGTMWFTLGEARSAIAGFVLANVVGCVAVLHGRRGLIRSE